VTSVNSVFVLVDSQPKLIWLGLKLGSHPGLNLY